MFRGTFPTSIGTLVLVFLAPMDLPPFIQSLSSTVPITDQPFDFTEKTGSAPPGGLNDMVSSDPTP